MPRSARLDIEGVLQHVMVRGIEKRDVFYDDQDRRGFVERFSKLLVETETECFAWALMSNHFHLLLRPTKTKLSVLMRKLLTGYAVVFNLRHNRCGHLFQNRYKSIVCEEDPYLLELIRYIHLNPLRVGLVPTLRDLDSYPWSGHSVIMGKAVLPGQAVVQVLRLFDESVSKAQRKYRSYVADGIALGKRDELVGGGLRRLLHCSGSTDRETYDDRVLGSGEFVEYLWDEAGQQGHLAESSPVLDDIIENVTSQFGIGADALCGRSKRKEVADARAVLCYLALRAGCRGVELSQKIKITRSAVVHAARRGEDIFKVNPSLSYLMQ